MTELEKAWNVICSCLVETEVYPMKDMILVADTLSKYQRCRWHDLRKNPNDLPNSDRNVEICFEFSKSKCYHTAYYDYEYMEWVMPMDTSPNETFENVIAWCEINPYEEEV